MGYIHVQFRGSAAFSFAKRYLLNSCSPPYLIESSKFRSSAGPLSFVAILSYDKHEATYCFHFLSIPKVSCTYISRTMLATRIDYLLLLIHNVA